MKNKIQRGNFVLNVNFNLRHTNPANELTAINAVVRFNNKRIVISGIDKVEPRYWNTDKQIPKQHAANERSGKIFQNINNAKTTIAELFDDYTERFNQYPDDIKIFQEQCRRAVFNLQDNTEKSAETKKSANFLEHFEKFLNDIKSGRRVISNGKNKGQPYAQNSHKAYGSVLTNLKNYIEFKKIPELHFNDIDLDFYTSFREYIVIKEGKTPGYFGTLIKCIKTIMSDAAEYGLHNSQKHKSKNFIKESSNADSSFLDNNKLEVLFKLDLNDNPRLDRTRDLFLIGCYTGLRWSDFTTIKPQDIQGDYIKVKTQKTSQRISIPITKNLRFILDKYEGKLPQPISNQKFNEYLKDLGDHAKFREMVDVVKYKNGKECIINVPFWQLITSHTARRSFATNMFKMGIPSILIMAITGHTTEKSFLSYIKMSNDDKAQMMMEIIRRNELKIVAG